MLTQLSSIDFDDTHQGLGGALDDADDAFNDDTFGDDGPATQQSVGRDFDFAGQTSKISGTIQEEQMLYQARQGFSRPAPQQQQQQQQQQYQQQQRCSCKHHHSPNLQKHFPCFLHLTNTAITILCSLTSTNPHNSLLPQFHHRNNNKNNHLHPQYTRNSN